jgi:hypothetical protein
MDTDLTDIQLQTLHALANCQRPPVGVDRDDYMALEARHFLEWSPGKSRVTLTGAGEYELLKHYKGRES